MIVKIDWKKEKLENQVDIQKLFRQGHRGCLKKNSVLRNRARFGTSKCDSYSAYISLGNIIYNSLLQYINDGSKRILREDWEEIYQVAKWIKDFTDTDSWDEFAKVGKDAVQRRKEFRRKKRNFKSAMSWLTKNWQGLWW
jgi:hypothetical protein